MVKLKDVIILKDLSILDEKFGPFKIRKMLMIGFGILLGYSFLHKGNLGGIGVIIAFFIIAMIPDRSISAEHRLLSMLYFYTLKTKPQDTQKKQSKKPAKNEKKTRTSNHKLGSLMQGLLRRGKK